MPQHGKRYVVQILDGARRVFSASARLDVESGECVLYIKEKGIQYDFHREPTKLERDIALSYRRFVHDIILYTKDFKKDKSLEYKLGGDSVLLATPV